MRALVITGEGYGNVLWSTPCAIALKEMGYEIDVLVEANWPDAWMIYQNTFVTRIFRDKNVVKHKDYDVILRTMWGRSDFPGQIKYDRLDPARFHEIEINMTTLSKLGYKGETPSPIFADITWAPHVNFSGRRVVLVDPAVNLPIWNRRKYPYIQQLAAKLFMKGCDVYMLGSTTDSRQWGSLSVGVEPEITENIYEAGKFLKYADVFIGQDCGLTQIAAAIGVPTIALFGPTRTSKNAPQGLRVNVLTANIPCAPCQLKPEFGECNDFKCMKSFRIEDLATIVLSTKITE